MVPNVESREATVLPDPATASPSTSTDRRPARQRIRFGGRFGANKDGTFRWYVEYEVPCPRGGVSQTILVATVTSAADRQVGFNRSENVRQVPFHCEQFRRIRSRCSDAESINRGINDALPEGRARSYGFRGVLANALTHALVTNSVSRARFEARGAATEHRPAA
jgi:hypothetical protein